MCLEMVEEETKSLQRGETILNMTSNPVYNKFWRRSDNAMAESSGGPVPPPPASTDTASTDAGTADDDLPVVVEDDSTNVVIEDEVTGDTVTTKDNDALDPRSPQPSPTYNGLRWEVSFNIAFWISVAVFAVVGYAIFPLLEAKLDQCQAESEAAAKAEAEGGDFGAGAASAVAVASAASTADHVDHDTLRDRFDQFDKNGDGSIGFQEFKEFVRAHPGVHLADDDDGKI